MAPTLISFNPGTYKQAAPKSLTKDTGTEFVATLGVIFSDLLLLPTELLRGVEGSHGLVASGRIADIKREIWNNQSVALKAFRTQSPWDLQEAKKILWKLVPIWKRLLHDNVLSFHGVGMSKSRLVLVYDWGHKGNITQYLESSPNASRPELVSVPLHSVRSTFSNLIFSCCKLLKGFNTFTPLRSSTAT